jgi:iron complex outermembrane receptor protein
MVVPRFVVFPFLLSSTLPQALAQVADSPEKPKALQDLIVTATAPDSIVAKRSAAATKTNVPLLETPQSVSVVSRGEIEQRGAQSVAEALTYTPGILIGVGGEDSRFDDILIRGYDAGSTSTNLYRDGLRVPAGGQWTRTQFDSFGLESIEAVKGPSAVLYGQVAPGGLVNMTSKRPTDTTRGSVSTQFSSFDTWQYTLDTSGPLDESGRLLYRFVGLHRDGGSQIRFTDLNRTYLAPSLTWNLSEDTSLTLLAAYQRDRGGATYQFLPVTGTLFPAPLGYIDRETFLGEPTHNRYDRDQFSIGYEFKHRFNEFLSFEQNARYAEIDTIYDGVVAGRTPPDAAGLMSRRAVSGFGGAHGFTIDSRLNAAFATGPLDHELTLGFDFIRSRWDHRRTGTNTVPPINIFKPVYTGIAAPFALQVGQDAVETQRGIYLQDLIKWNKWHLTLGGRYDNSDIALLNTMTNVTAYSESEAYTGRAGLLYRFDNGIAPYASVATSFEPVSGTDVNGTPFDPTEGKQVEFGLKYEPSGINALFTASVFQLNQENVLTLDPANPLFQIQTGEIELRGIELEAKVALAEGLSVTGGWTFMDSEIVRNNNGFVGNDFPNVPHDTGALWIDYTFQSGPLAGLGLGTGVRYVGQRLGDQANLYKIPGYTLLDAGIRYDLGKLTPSLKGMRVSLTGSNLEDKTYVAKAETVSSANYGPGRTVRLNVSYDW